LTPDGGQLLRRDYDMTIADQPFDRRPAGPGPWLVRYRAVLAVEQPGSHQFELRGDGAVRLLIDGRQVWPQSGEGPSQLGAPERNRARVSIPAGLVPIVVEQTDGGSLALLWQQGSSPPSLLPPSALAPVPWP
jgi:hypothetical protein